MDGKPSRQTAQDPPSPDLGPWYIAQVVGGIDVEPIDVDACPDPWPELVRRMLGRNGTPPRDLFDTLLSGRPDAGELLKAVFRFQPGDPSPIDCAAPKKEAAAQTIIVWERAPEIAAMAGDKPDWIARGLLARGAITELDGKPKVAGKTTFEMFLFAALRHGKPFLGLETVKTGVVLLTEQTPASLRESMALAGLLDWEDLIVVRWHANRGVPFDDIVEQAADLAIEQGYGVLGVDTISQWAGIVGDSENQSGAALAAMEPCQEAAGRIGPDGRPQLGVWIVRHDRKGGGDVGDSGRGSNAWTGAVNIVLRLTRREPNAPKTQRLLSTLSHFRETPEELVIDLQPGGYLALGAERAVVANNVRETILLTLPTAFEVADDPAEKGWKLDTLFLALPTDAGGKKPARSTVLLALEGLTNTDLAERPALVNAMKIPTRRGQPIVYWLTTAGEAERARIVSADGTYPSAQSIGED